MILGNDQAELRDNRVGSLFKALTLVLDYLPCIALTLGQYRY